MVQATKKLTDALGSQIQPGTVEHAEPAVCMANAKDTACSYSDVIASQPSSPASAIKEEAPSSDSEAFTHPVKVEGTLVNITEVVSTNNTKTIVTDNDNHKSNTSLLNDLSNTDKNKNLWTTVVCRHSRSLDSLKRNTMPSKKVQVVQN